MFIYHRICLYVAEYVYTSQNSLCFSFAEYVYMRRNTFMCKRTCLYLGGEYIYMKQADKLW